MAVFHVKNFVDYGKVKHDGNHIEKFFEPVVLQDITPSAIGKESLRIRIVEHQVSLQDSLFQLLTESEDFSMLNLSTQNLYQMNMDLSKDAYFTFIIDLSQEIRIEKRTVIDFLNLFGEIGGFKEVLILLIAISLSGF